MLKTKYRMMKRLFLSVVSITMAAGVFAQSVQDGIKALYYDQYKKAKDILGKAVVSNPADAEANYWLGQAFLDDDDVAKAKEVYTKALTATNQNPLIVVGLGHVELLEGKKAEARAHFDGALEPTKTKKNKKYGDPQLLAAIGRANADGGSAFGEPDYGIEKLTQAAELDPKNPEIMISTGLNYLKKGGEFGGKAKSAYESALDRDPNYAEAYLRIGKIFESQRNTELFLENYNKSVSTDPKFVPGYLALYNYYSNRDVNKAKEYLDKYMANTEKDRETDYFYADYLLRAGRYQESLDKAKEIESALNGESYPKVYNLMALNYERLGDSLTAKTNVEKYLSLEVPAKISAESYSNMANIFIKTGDAAKADEMANYAIGMDTVLENKLKIMASLADANAAAKNFKGEYDWRRRAMDVKPDSSARNYYFLINSAINGGAYAAADTFSQKYISSYPDQAQGYYFRVKAAMLADVDTTLGSAIPAIDEYNAFLAKDVEKNKSRIITNVGYKVYFYANKAKDYEKAIAALDEILAVDATNQYALSAKEQLQKILNKKTSGSGASTGSSSGSKTGKPAAN
jgi:Tfp pilus assembly protein PilF